MQVQLLGPVAVFVDGEPIDLGGSRNRALVARLALAVPYPVAATALVDDLWGAEPPHNAHNALQSVVSRTRGRLPADTLLSVNGGYRLDIATTDVDALRFDALVRDHRPREALALWQGAPLSGIDAAGFAGPAATALEERRVGAIEDRVEDDLTSGTRDPSTLAAELGELTAAHPYRERLWVALMRSLAAAGRVADALAAYDTLRTTLADNLGLDPSETAQQLQGELLRGEIARSSVDPHQRPRTNLRAALTSFVGREGAVEDVIKEVETARLVTLLGPGGAGKTRLAVETARRLAPRYPDGSWLVELASVTDPTDILDAIIAALDLRDVLVIDRPAEQRTGDRDRLLAALDGRRTLLVVDNCEHLIDGVATVVDDLLQHVEGIDVLATSREPLGIAGEVSFPVASLTVPADTLAVDEALDYSAVDLFVQRARAASPSFSLDAVNLPAVIEICRRLDGQPLAIELAAARLRSLSVTQVAARLGDRFRLLTGGSRTALPRHRTLRAVVEWSWDLLDENERHLAERAAVFPAGITVPAAAAISETDEATAFDRLTSLADKSLLIPVDQSGEPRYRMLETLREYGAERLVERGESDTVRHRHAAYFVALAEHHEPLLRRAEQVDSLAHLDADRGNLLAAVRYALEREDAATAARLVIALMWYLTLRNQHEEVFELSSRVLELPGPLSAKAELLCVAMNVVVMFDAEGTADVEGVADVDDDTDAGDATDVERVDLRPGSAQARRRRAELVERLTTVRQRPDLDHDDPIIVLVELAADLFSLVPGRDAVDDVDLSRGFGHHDPWVRGAARFLWLAWRENAGLPVDAGAVLAEALAAFRQSGDRWGEAMAESSLASVCERAGLIAEARVHLQAAVRLLGVVGAADDTIHLRTRLVLLDVRAAARADDSADAEHLVADVESMRKQLAAAFADAAHHGHREGEAWCVIAGLELERWLGDPDAAVSRAYELIRTFDTRFERGPQVRAMVLTMCALTVLTHDAADARAWLDRAAKEALASGDMPIVAGTATGFAVLAAADGDPDSAARRLGAATQIRGIEDRADPDTAVLRAQLVEALGEDRFSARYAEGANLSREDAIALGLSATAG